MAKPNPKYLMKRESVEKLFECPICLKPFQKPKNLSCGHTFCLECLQKQERLSDSGFVKSCPVCNQSTIRIKATDFPNAYIADQMVERIKRMDVFTSPDNKDNIIEKIYALIVKRKELKEKEECEIRESMNKKKEEIEKVVQQIAEDLLEQVTSILEKRKAKLLSDVETKFCERVKTLECNLKDVDSDENVWSWLRLNTSDDLEIPDLPRHVLPPSVRELTSSFINGHTPDILLRALDPAGGIRGITDDEEPRIVATTAGKTEKIDKVLTDPVANIDFPQPLRSIDTPPIRDSTGSPHSPLQSTVAYPKTSTRPLVPKSPCNVKIQLWTRGGHVSGTKLRTRRLASDSQSKKKSFQNKISRSKSLNETEWQPCETTFQLTIGDRSRPMRLHSTKDFMSLAVETDEGTKMWVFSYKIANRRRPPLNSKASPKGASRLAGITTLANDEGWCMLLKDILLIFDINGRLSDHTSNVSGINFLCAVTYKPDHLIYIDENFELGVISISNENIEIKPIETDLKLTGSVLSLASANNSLFVANTHSENREGTIVCLTGLESGSVVRQARIIRPPSGFAEVCQPTGICCDKNGSKLFALWRDDDNKKGIIIEYCVEDRAALQNIVLEDANDVYAISCTPDDKLITCTCN